MELNRSTLRVRQACCGGTERIPTSADGARNGSRNLVGVSLLALCLLITAGVWGQESRSVSDAPEEPQALPAPPILLPVEEASATTRLVEAEVPPPRQEERMSSNVAPASAPPIRLAPEPLLLKPEKAKQITSAVEGIRPASFKELTPGESTRQDVLAKLGDPRETTSSEAQEVLGFALGPFPSVQVTLVDHVVTSIVIHLAAPTKREEVVKELKLEGFLPVTIQDNAGHAVGEVYPERALMFAYAESTSAQGDPTVGQVVLERISVEPFLLRVEQRSEEQMAKRLVDLRTVQQLLPDDAEAFALAARLDNICGRLDSALEAASRAVELDPAAAEYRIVLSDIRRQRGERSEAVEALQNALQDSQLAKLDEAEARTIYGRILATTPTFDYKQGMQETVAAIKLAAAQINSDKREIRTRARQLLIRAELSLAEILAYGPWKQKHEVVPQWLASAEKAANESIEKDGASSAVLLSVYRTSLHCLLVLEGQGAPDTIADAAIQLGRELIAQSEDEDFQALVEWRLGVTLWHAAQILHDQGQPDNALQLANNADVLLTDADKVHAGSRETSHHLAQLHFLMGSIYAIHKRDHDTATSWYDKAVGQLSEASPDSLLDERGLLGERMVSIGISLWETDRKNQAISVTKEGADLIAAAIQDGTFKKVALAVPYQNLAEMYRQLGNQKQADLMAKKAAEYETPAPDAKKRR